MIIKVTNPTLLARRLHYCAWRGEANEYKGAEGQIAIFNITGTDSLMWQDLDGVESVYMVYHTPPTRAASLFPGPGGLFYDEEAS